MNHYWNNNVAEVGDGVVIVVGGKVYLLIIYTKNSNNNNRNNRNRHRHRYLIYDASAITSTRNNGNMSNDDDIK